MLSVLRRNKNSPVIVVLLILVAVLMIGFGVSLQGSGEWPPAAKVGGEEIPGQEFQVEYAKEFRNRQASIPRYDRAAAEQENLRKQVLDRMVLVKRLAQLADDAGLAIDDQALREAILENPAFQEEGQFSRRQYERVLSMNQLTDQAYEAKERERLLANAFLAAIGSLNTSDIELKQAFERENRRVDVAFVQLPKADFEVAVGAIIPEDVAAWEKATPDADKAVEAYYKAHKATDYDVAKRVCAQSILVRTDKTLPPDKQKEQRDKIEAAVKALKRGTDFAKVAAEYSDDQNKDKGGDLGCLTDKQLPEAMAQAAFGLKVGELSPIVEGPFGLQVLKVSKFLPAVHKTLDEVKPEIKAALTKQGRASKLAKAKAAALLAQAKTDGGLEAAVAADKKQDKASSLKVETTGPFAEGRPFLPKLGMAPKVAEAAWALKTAKELAAAPLETPKAWVVIELKERKEADPADFDAAKTMLTYREVMPKTQKSADWVKAVLEGQVTDVDPVAISYDAKAEKIREQRWQMARGR